MRLIPWSFAALSFALGGCSASLAKQPAPQAATTTVPGMVSAADHRAAEAGAEMLRLGGSATDAAIATMLALTVVEPQSSGIGGGGFYVASDPAGHVETINGREKAPAAATPDWFLLDGQPRGFRDARTGGLATGVPGNIALAALAHQRHGRLAWAKLFDPAIRLAEGGFVISRRLNRALSSGDDEESSIAALTPAGRALFFGADGKPLPVGTIVRNPALAAFYRRLAAGGPAAFYRGDNGEKIAAAVFGATRNPAPMTAADVAAMTATHEPAVCGQYRSYRVCGMGPPSSGATTVYAILKQLERFDLHALGKDNVVAWHLMAESERLAYADRDKYLADDDFVSVPVAGLIDPAYLASRSALIDPAKSLPHAEPGSPPGTIAMNIGRASDGEEHGTSHFSVVDSAGNAVAYTSTIESAFGSGLVVNGYYLNNELTDFSFRPVDAGGRPIANRVEGGKRPRSSMSPTIVYGPDGHIRLIVGAAGGSTIPAQVAKAIIGVIDFELTAQEALSLPTIFGPGDKIYVEEGTMLQSMIPELQALGHANIGLSPPSTYKANAIEWKDGRWGGAADPRSEGKAVSQ